MSVQLPDGKYSVIAPRFHVGLRIVYGKVDANLTAPELRRLGGMNADAFACYARAKGWRLEAVKEEGAPPVLPTEKTEPLRVPLADLAARSKKRT